MIFYLMGKSSSGKDTIFRRLMEDEDLSLETIVSYTTRPIREGEVEGVEYHFVKDYEMEEMEKKGLVIEKRTYDTVCGLWNYFTAIDTEVNVKKNNYILIGTLEAYVKIRDFYGSENVLPIYIQVDDGKRLMRALNREMEQQNPKYAEMCRRFLADCEDFSEEKLEEIGIQKRFNNDDINKCIGEIESYIKENI
jgi:guanylate kinase